MQTFLALAAIASGSSATSRIGPATTRPVALSSHSAAVPAIGSNTVGERDLGYVKAHIAPPAKATPWARGIPA
jgi:hypothetical protein